MSQRWCSMFRLYLLGTHAFRVLQSFLSSARNNPLITVTACRPHTEHCRSPDTQDFRVLLCFHRCDRFNPPTTCRATCTKRLAAEVIKGLFARYDVERVGSFSVEEFAYLFRPSLRLRLLSPALVCRSPVNRSGLSVVRLDQQKAITLGNLVDRIRSQKTN